MAENQPDLKQHGGAAPDPSPPIKFELGSPVVDSLRVRYPGLEHLDDQTFMRGVRKKFFPTLDERQFLRGMSRKFGEKPEPGFFERFGNQVLNAAKQTKGAASTVRGARFIAESGALGKIGDRIAGGEAPSFEIEGGSPAGNILATGAGVFKGVTDFGKGVADALVGVDTPESRLAKDMLKELELDARYAQNYIMGPFAALDLAARGDIESANRIMNDVHQEYGPRGLATLVSLPADIAAFGAARRIGGSMMKAAAASGAAGGGTYGFIHSVAEGKSPEEVAINTSIGTGGGAAAGMLFALGLRGINPHAALGDVDMTPVVRRAQESADELVRDRVGVPAAGRYTNAYDPNVVIPENRAPSDFLDIARRATGAAEVDLPPTNAVDDFRLRLERGEQPVTRGAAPEPAPRRGVTAERGLEEIVREQAGIEPARGLTGAAPVVPERVPGAAGTPEPGIAGEVIPPEIVPPALEPAAAVAQRAAARPRAPGAGAPTQVPPAPPGVPQLGAVAPPGVTPTQLTPEQLLSAELRQVGQGPEPRVAAPAREPAERFGVAGLLPERAGGQPPQPPTAEAIPGLERRPLAGQVVTTRAAEAERITAGVQALQGPDTGFTYNPDFSEYTGGGKIVGVLSENVPITGPGDPNVAAAVRRMADQAAPILERFGDNAKIGVFQLDEATASVDLNIVVDDVDRAVRIGRQAGQRSVWDADAGQLVETGLTGEQPSTSLTQAADILERELAPSQRAAPGIVATTPAEQAVVKAVAPAPEPGPGRAHQIDVFADQMIETASERIKARNQGRLSAFVDPADVADAALIGAGYLLRGTAKFADWSALMVQKFGDGVKPHLQRLFTEAQAVHSARRSAGNDPVRLVADTYMRGIGLGPAGLPGRIERLNEPLMKRVANAYERLPNFRDTPQVRTAYKKFTDEVDLQFQAILDEGYTVEFVDKDPYPNSAAMLKDLAENKRLRVFNTPEAPHPLLTAEQNNRFRAVHDFFGHGKEGYQFGPEGEFNAWREHAAMFSDKSIPAMSTETLGQNAWVNFNKNVVPGSPLRDRPFAAQKAALLPEALWKPAITTRKAESARLAAGTLQKKTLGMGVVDVGRKLTQRVRPAKTPRAQAARAEADVKAAVQEHLVERPRSREWYKSSIDKTDDLVRVEFPQTEDPGQMGLFKLLLAASSSGNKPEVNMGFAMTMFDRFSESGKVPLVGRAGQEQGRFGRHAVPAINNLMREFDGDLTAMTNHLMQRGEDGEKNAARLFGPKIGRFFLNLMGDLDEPTVDVWMRRWWGRINNDLFGPGGALLDAPKNDSEAALMRDTITRLAEDSNMRPAELQAILWEREKALWTKAGARDPGDMDFAQAAELVIRNRNIRAGEVGARLERPAQVGLFDQAVAQPAVPNQRASDLLTALLGANKKPKKPTEIGEQPFWIAPTGEIVVENFGRHPISAKQALAKLGEEAPRIIGRQHGGIHTMEQAGFIRGQGQFGTANFELVRKPTSQQRAVMGQIIKERGFGGAQIFDDAGEAGAFSQAWGEFLRFVDEIKE